MKKLITIAAVAMLVGAAVGQAQTITTTINTGIVALVGPISVDVKIKTSNKSEATVNGVSWARLEDTSDGSIFDVMGTTILDTSSVTNGTTNTVTGSLSSNVFLFGDTPVTDDKGKFATAMSSDSDAPFGMSNSAWFVQGSLKSNSKGTNVSAKAEGIYKEGVSAFKGSFKTSK